MFSKNKVNYLSLLIIILQIFLIKTSQPNDIKSKISQLITNFNSKTEQERIKLISNKGGITHTEDGYGIQISLIGNQSYTDSQNIKFPQVNITEDCKNTIKEKYNNASDVIVTKLFTTFPLDENTVNYKVGITEFTDVLYYQFFPFINNVIENTKPIDISSTCGEDIIIFAPLYIDEMLKNKFVAVAGQNPKNDIKKLRDYDIFDPNAKIYKDICYPLTFSYASENIITKDSFKNYDITLEQRKKYYFPGNLMLCPEDCTYLGTDKDTVSTMCQCEFYNKYTLTGTEITSHKTYTSFTYDEKKFNKTKKDNYFSMDTLKCIKLPFTKSGFKGNYGSIIMIALICIVFLSFLILLISGKYHLLSVLELLYNSNIKSMNYIKNQNFGNQIPFDVRSNNYLLNSQRGITTNGLLMSNILSGSNYMQNNALNKSNPIRVGKKTNSSKSGIQIVNKNALNKNKPQKDLIKVDEVKENDFESERNSFGKDKTGINSMNIKSDLGNTKNSDKMNNSNQNQKLNLNTKNEEKNQPKKEESNKSLSEEEDEQGDDEISNEDKDNKNNSQNNVQNNSQKKEENNDKRSEQNQSNDNDDKNKKEDKDDKDESKDEDEESDEEGEEDDDSKANPPKKKNGTTKLGKNNSNGNNDNGMNGNENTKKRKKSKTPIEIALNVKELRDMMLQSMPKETNNANENGKTSQPPPQNNPSPSQNNGFNFNPFMNPFSLIPPPYPNYNYNNNNNTKNEDTIRKEYEEKARQRELEYQKERELAEIREKQRRKELEELYEKDLKRQRDLEYERERRQRDDLLRNYDKNYRDRDRDRDNDYYDKDKDDQLKREREKLNQQNEEIKKLREKMEKEYNDKQYQDREKDLQLQKELSKIKDQQRDKEIEFEKELLKQKELLKEQYEKEKKEIIEKKDREIQLLREEKDREIQRLKEDKDRELKYMKEDMDREKKTQQEKIKRKEKEFKKEKQKIKEMQKLTSNSFFANGINANSTMQQQIMEINNNLYKSEKIDSPQIVVPIDSIFTDQELNAMDFNNSCIYDKRTLCQTYFSYINRKQPLFFLFNYNSSSSSSISTFQINYKSVKFIIFCVELMIYMFFYATFFGSKSITSIYLGKFNFRKKCIFGIIITPFCMIVKSIIHHFIYDKMNVKIAEIKMRCYTNFIVGRKPEEIKVNEFKDFWESEEEQKNNEKEERKEEMADIQEIEDDNLPEEEKARRKEKYEKRKLKTLIKELIELFKKKIFISAIIMLFVLFFMWIYISAFCAVYKNSQLVFFVNILISFGFANLIPFVYCLVPTIFRQDGVKEQSRFAFFLSQIFQII